MAHVDYFSDIATLSRAIRARRLSAVELTTALLARIRSLDGKLRSFVTVTNELALAQARAADEEIAVGRWRGPLHGVPIAVKDLLWTKGIPTTAGMPIHADFRPPADATVISRLAAAGAVLLGKLGLTESLGRNGVAGSLVQRIGRGRRLWPVRRGTRHRYRRIDPFSLGGKRCDRP
jgi:Asp-tRNA(Asn)/Glu-tRNA(Gln) amidotransferase A subunit family amidase